MTLINFKGIVKGFKENGFRTQSQPLSSFYESYGLEADEDEAGNEDSDDADEDMEDVEDEDDSDDSDEMN